MQEKRPSSCPSLGGDSCSNGSSYEAQVNDCKLGVKCEVDKHYRTRFFYNSSVRPKVIESSLARKSSDNVAHVKNTVKSRQAVVGLNLKTCQKQNSNDTKVSSVDKGGAQHIFSHPVAQPLASSMNGNNSVRDEQIPGVEQAHVEASHSVDSGLGLNLRGVQDNDPTHHTGHGLNPCNQSSDQVVNQHVALESDPVHRASVNVACANDTNLTDQYIPIYDVNHVGVEEKFVNSIMHHKQFGDQLDIGNNQCQILQKWREQSDFDFGFIPLGEQDMPDTFETNVIHTNDLIEIHEIVKETGKPNFMQARIPVKSQLNVEVWEKLLKNYWDQQLLQLLRFCFPLDFNRNRQLHCDGGNHSSATEYPKDVDAYIQAETSYGAILGPFKENPIKNSHTSPLMTRNKPNSDRCRVIIDLSWPIGASVNSGIDKDTYLGTPFALTFPTVDVITDELKHIGRGALLYKIDVSRALRGHLPAIWDTAREPDFSVFERCSASRHASERFLRHRLY